ncbi:RHS repeat-associated protein [Chryseobacterium sp. H1D6B]|nr:RHS repeat-associated protein [Chryseobacterium sp. H1D6B]
MFVHFLYIYNYTDHLGNVRLSYLNNGSGAEVLEENNYYPFGLKHEGYNVLNGNPAYKYQYKGKELQEESGMYDYGARSYMPDLGRWGVVDPLAEVSRRWTPYNYAFNNPIRFVDPDGMMPVSSLQEMWDNTSGSSTWTNNGNGTFDGGEDDKKKKNIRKTGSSSGMSEGESLKELVTIGGKKYHKNTGNLGAQIGNTVNSFFCGDDDYFVEHKEFDKADDNFIHAFTETAFYEVTGIYVLKGLGKAFKLLKFNKGSSLASQISAEAESNGIKSAQRGIDPNVVTSYYEQMVSGTYKSTGGAGYIHEGKYILTDGNHRMNAAIQYGIKTGNFRFVEEIITKGNFHRANPSNYGIKVYKLPTK